MARPRIHCASPDCGQEDILAVPHLRVKLSSPGQPWRDVRACDALCFSEWLEAEIEPFDGYKRTVFTEEEWIDSSGHADDDADHVDDALPGG